MACLSLHKADQVASRGAAPVYLGCVRDLGEKECVLICRFLLTWLLFLPFAVFKTFQWFTPGVCAVVAFLLFGVEVLPCPVLCPAALHDCF